jgi:hypothetical protein
MTKYIPHIHPHRFPTAKLRTFPHMALSQFTPILSQFAVSKKGSEARDVPSRASLHFMIFSV